ncbi:MAG: hypothetical protein NTZ83_01740 [Candidatus Pacearchaeota archaeon]|nr:hypothetical protein [Candidatus Pacearchaeota archaeon]
MGEKKRLNKKGQVTIFIIIALLIVALCILVYLYYPKIFASISPETKNPVTYIQECIQEQIEENVQIISLQGGSYVVDENIGYFYKKEGEDGNYVKYLCYTGSNVINTPCINQEPFLTEHVEQEILDSINQGIKTCFDNLVKSYENKGYEVDLKEGIPKVEIIPEGVSTNFNRTLTLTKGDETNTYRKFEVNLNSNLYEMLEVAKNILIWEMNVGDSLPEAYMYNNPYLKVEKRTKDNDVRIYILTDRNTEESFRFAVRSFPLPAGFGTGYI